MPSELRVFWDYIANCNRDEAVDFADYADFEVCVAGPDVGVGSECDCFDFDHDEDSDLADFTAFQAYFIGN